MLMSLGNFVFELATLAPTEVNSQIDINWQKQNRFSERPSVQFTGISGETVNLSGRLYPTSKITGTASDLQKLKDMSVTGEEYVLVGGDGYVRGLFAIRSIAETHTVFLKDGQARKIEFRIRLERTDNERTTRLPRSTGLSR